MKHPTATPLAGSAPVARGCASCAALRDRLEEVTRERDAALERADEEHARAELFLRAVPDASWDSSQPPLRYRLADRAHEVLKSGAPFLHSAAKRVGGWVDRATSRPRGRR